MALSKPFAENGNKVSIALEKTDDGVMNYEEGFGARYEQPIKAVIDEKGNIVSTGGLQITRPQFNGLMNDLSEAIIENQEKIIANRQHIIKVENTMSGCAFLVRDNKFGGLNSFSGATSFKAEVSFEANASFDTADFNTISATAIHSNTIKTNSISAASAYIREASFENINAKNVAVSASAAINTATISAAAIHTLSVKTISASAASIDSLSINVNPEVLKPLIYSAMASNMLLTKKDLEDKLPSPSVTDSSSSESGSIIYSAMASSSIITKEVLDEQTKKLEKQLIDLKKIISAITDNIVGGNASFDTLKVKHLIVSSGANVISGSANTATTTTFTDSGLHLVKFKNFKN